jgi:desampylase
MTLYISSKLHQQLLAEASASPHAEICGILIGDAAIERLIAAPNVSTDPSHAFEIDPTTLFAAIRGERAGEGRILGYYHSHPHSGAARPSATDTMRAPLDGRIWLIVTQREITAWRKDEANKFKPVALTIDD